MSLHDPERPTHPDDYSRRAVQHRGTWHILPLFQILRESGGFIRPEYHTLCGRRYFAIKPDRHMDKAPGPFCSHCETILQTVEDIDERILQRYGN